MHIGFVSGLSDHKLAQKLAPLQAMSEVGRISLFRRQPFSGEKVVWQAMPEFIGHQRFIGDPWRMAQLLYRGKECDLLVGCHQRFHGVMTAIAGKILNIPTAQLIITEFDLMWGHPAFRWAIRQAVLVGVRGQKARDRCLSSLASNPPATFIPHNLFNPQTTAAPEPALGREFDIIYIGSFTFDKNIPLLVRVLAGIKRQKGSLRACIIGQGPEKEHFKTLLAEQGLLDDVTLLGNQPHADLGKYYAKAKLFLLTSRFEGFPMVVPEAMGWGTPVVTTDVGDLADLVINGKNGFLVENGDCDRLIDSCMQIITSPKLAQTMSDSARLSHSDFVAACSLESIVAIWRKAFSELASRQNSKALPE